MDNGNKFYPQVVKLSAYSLLFIIFMIIGEVLSRGMPMEAGMFVYYQRITLVTLALLDVLSSLLNIFKSSEAIFFKASLSSIIYILYYAMGYVTFPYIYDDFGITNRIIYVLIAHAAILFIIISILNRFSGHLIIRWRRSRN